MGSIENLLVSENSLRNRESQWMKIFNKYQSMQNEPTQEAEVTHLLDLYHDCSSDAGSDDESVKSADFVEITPPHSTEENPETFDVEAIGKQLQLVCKNRVADWMAKGFQDKPLDRNFSAAANVQEADMWLNSSLLPKFITNGNSVSTSAFEQKSSISTVQKTKQVSQVCNKRQVRQVHSETTTTIVKRILVHSSLVESTESRRNYSSPISDDVFTSPPPNKQSAVSGPLVHYSFSDSSCMSSPDVHFRLPKHHTDAMRRVYEKTPFKPMKSAQKRLSPTHGKNRKHKSRRKKHRHVVSSDTETSSDSDDSHEEVSHKVSKEPARELRLNQAIDDDDSKSVSSSTNLIAENHRSKHTLKESEQCVKDKENTQIPAVMAPIKAASHKSKESKKDLLPRAKDVDKNYTYVVSSNDSKEKQRHPSKSSDADDHINPNIKHSAAQPSSSNQSKTGKTLRMTKDVDEEMACPQKSKEMNIQLPKLKETTADDAHVPEEMAPVQKVNSHKSKKKHKLLSKDKVMNADDNMGVTDKQRKISADMEPPQTESLHKSNENIGTVENHSKHPVHIAPAETKGSKKSKETKNGKTHQTKSVDEEKTFPRTDSSHKSKEKHTKPSKTKIENKDKKTDAIDKYSTDMELQPASSYQSAEKHNNPSRDVREGEKMQANSKDIPAKTASHKTKENDQRSKTQETQDAEKMRDSHEQMSHKVPKETAHVQRVKQAIDDKDSDSVSSSAKMSIKNKLKESNRDKELTHIPADIASSKKDSHMSKESQKDLLPKTKDIDEEIKPHKSKKKHNKVVDDDSHKIAQIPANFASDQSSGSKKSKEQNTHPSKTKIEDDRKSANDKDRKEPTEKEPRSASSFQSSEKHSCPTTVVDKDDNMRANDKQKSKRKEKHGHQSKTKDAPNAEYVDACGKDNNTADLERKDKQNKGTELSGTKVASTKETSSKINKKSKRDKSAPSKESSAHPKDSAKSSSKKEPSTDTMKAKNVQAEANCADVIDLTFEDDMPDPIPHRSKRYQRILDSESDSDSTPRPEDRQTHRGRSRTRKVARERKESAREASRTKSNATNKSPRKASSEKANKATSSVNVPKKIDVDVRRPSQVAMPPPRITPPSSKDSPPPKRSLRHRKKQNAPHLPTRSESLNAGTSSESLSPTTKAKPKKTTKNTNKPTKPITTAPKTITVVPKTITIAPKTITIAPNTYTTAAANNTTTVANTTSDRSQCKSDSSMSMVIFSPIKNSTAVGGDNDFRFTTRELGDRMQLTAEARLQLFGRRKSTLEYRLPGDAQYTLTIDPTIKPYDSDDSDTDLFDYFRGSVIEKRYIN